MAMTWEWTIAQCCRNPPPKPHYTHPETLQDSPAKTLYKNKIKLELVKLLNHARTNMSSINSYVSLATKQKKTTNFTDEQWTIINRHLQRAKTQLQKVNQLMVQYSNDKYS